MGVKYASGIHIIIQQGVCGVSHLIEEACSTMFQSFLHNCSTKRDTKGKVYLILIKVLSFLHTFMD